MLSGIRTLTQRRGTRAFVLVAILLATVFSFGASFMHSGTKANAANTNIHGTLTSSPVSTKVAAHSSIDLSTAPKLTSNSSQPAQRIRTNLPLPASARAKAVGVTGHAPSAVTEAKAPSTLGPKFVGGGTTPLLGANANGLDSTQGGGWYPPDQAIAVGGAGAAVNQYVVEGVNNAVAIYNVNLGLVAGPYASDTVFGGVQLGGDHFSDPQITYDADRVHWIIVYLELTPGNTPSGLSHGYIDIAVSKTINPNGVPSNYFTYRFDANVLNDNEWCDYPTLGMEYWNLYVSCATFDINRNFLGNRIFVFNKTDLIAGSGSPRWTFFRNIPTGVSCGTGCLLPLFRLAPAIEDGVPNAEYVVGTDAGWLGSGLSSNMTLLAITNPNALATGTTLMGSYITGPLAAAYSDPIGAAQPGTAALVDAGVGVKQFMYKGGSLWFSFTTAVNWNGDSATRDGVYWTEVHPFLGTKAAHDPQLLTGWSNIQQQYLGYVGSYTFMSSIQPSDEGDAALVFNWSSSSVFPSIVYTGRKGDDALNTMGQGTSLIVASGSNSNDSGRWGDYSACALNVQPTSRGFAYCAGEYGGTHTALGGIGWDTYMYVLRMN